VARDYLQPTEFAVDELVDGFFGEEGDGPRFFGGFELLEELGRGGSGVVYRARQVSLGREVAIKFLLDGAFAGDRAIARFQAEAAAAAELRHPHIVTIHEVGQIEGRHYFSMELVEGQTLAEVVRDGPLPAPRAASYVQRVAEAVGFAHARGVLHRDLKPSNVLLDQDDQPRVSDFGLAKRTGESVELTGTGQVLGTPAYMSPEQAEGGRDRPVDERSDVYSLGAILYHLLGGRPPFTGDTVTAILRQVSEAEPVAPRLLNPSVPRDLETICLQCLSKDPVRRYPTAVALAEDLGRFLRGEWVQARPESRIEKGVRWCRKRPALALALGGIGVLLGALVLISVQSARRVERLRLGSLTNLYASDLRLAQHMMDDHRFGSAKALLDRHRTVAGDPDLRGFEWRHLNALCASEEAATLGVHGAQVQRMAVSKDGRWLASVSADLRVWEVATRRLVLSKPLVDYGWALGFSPDSREVVVVDSTGVGLRFAVESGEELPVPRSVGRRAMAVAWSELGTGPDLLAAGRMIRWDAATGEAGEGGAMPEAFSRAFVTADGRQAALILGRGEAALWDLERSTEAARFRLPLPARVVVWLPKQQRMVAGDLSGSLHVWEREGGEPIRTLPAHRGMIECLAISPDGLRLASAGADQVIRIWDTATWQQVDRLQGHRAFVFGLVFGLDGKTLFSGDRLGTVKEWRMDDSVGKPALDFGTQGFLSMDGGLLFRVGTNATGTVHDPVQPKVVVSEMAWLPGWIPIPTTTGMLARDLEGGLQRRRTNGVWMTVGPVRMGGSGVIAASPDGRFVCHRMDGGGACSVVEVEGGREVIRFNDDPTWIAPTFSGDGRRFCTGSASGRVRLYELPSGRMQGTIEAHHGYAYACDLSRDGAWLATAGFDGYVRLWSTESRRLQAEFQSTVESFWTVALSLDGRRIAAGTGESTVIIWDVPSRLEVATLGMGEPLLPVEGLLRFTPDGSTLVLGGVRWRTWHGLAGE
jgi:WD40 repeat protein